MSSRFRGEDLAVVTGGTKGIGRAVVEQLVSEGVPTVAIYKSDEDRANECRSALGDVEPETRVYQVDVSDYSEAVAGFKTIVEEVGRPSILVNNAGIMRNHFLRRLDPEQWDEVIQTNLSGTFHCTRAASRHMLRKSRGSIVNVSSVAAQRGYVAQANYAASKSGVIGFTRAAARELGNDSLRVNAISPGYTDTPLYRNSLSSRTKIAGDEQEDFRDDIPLDRIADPAEIANAIIFLASDEASYVNGTVLRVDGGLLA
ncbi:short-chain dehydrogenase [Halobacteriales archaeon QS_1_69_70]|nr:MAG: short-chain dehydrogenase [Halobacteriales archaeon QS_1_69_70]